MDVIAALSVIYVAIAIAILVILDDARCPGIFFVPVEQASNKQQAKTTGRPVYI
jgi:hypothetical protein